MSEFPPQPSPGAPLSEWAVWCATVGRLSGAFKVFPLCPGEKRPLRQGWQTEAAWDTKSVQVMWMNDPEANVGLAIQPGYVALDADLYKPGNEAKLAAFEDAHGVMPETMEFASARGGVHLIYRTDTTFGNARGELPDFGDVRGYGGLLVGPGSNFDGRQYRPEYVQQPATLPEHVASKLRVRGRAAGEEKVPPPFVEVDDPRNQQAYADWLKSAYLGTPGVDGNNTLAATGAMGASFALSLDVTVQLMDIHWNSRQDEAWSPEELMHHGGSGWRSSSSPYGNMAARNPMLMFEPRPGQAGWGPQLRTAAYAAETEPPPRQWALGTDDDGWMPLGDLTLLYGPGGGGKTTLAGQICLAMARGEDLFGLIPCRQMPALFIAGEDDEAEIHRRFQKQGIRRTDRVQYASMIGHDMLLHPPLALVRDGELPPDTPFFQFLDFHLNAMGQGPKLLVLDNKGTLYGDNYFDTTPIMRFLNLYARRLAMRHNATMLILAHPSESQKQSGDGGFGGVAWSAGVRSRLYFDHVRQTQGAMRGKVDGSGVRLLSRKKANYTKTHGDGEGVALRWEDWNFTPATIKPAAEPEAKGGGLKPTSTRYSDVATRFVVQKALEDYLERSVGMSYSARTLSTNLSAVMGQAGHELAPDTIRTNHLPALIAGGHKYFHPEGRGFWACKNEAAKGSREPTVS